MTSLSTVDPAQLDALALFSRLPDNRVGAADRRYVDEVLKDGFGNRESADMLGRKRDDSRPSASDRYKPSFVITASRLPSGDH